MNEEKAKAYLSSALPDDLYIVGFNEKLGNVFLFSVKDKKYKDDDFVLPQCYGVREDGKVLDDDGVSDYFKELGIG